MNTYDATVRLGGDTAHEVNKAGLTAPEIMVLRRIHGLDAVVRIVPAQSVTRSNREERDRLRKLYCDRDATAGLVNELFGPDHTPLPNTLDADEEVVAAEAATQRELKEDDKTTLTSAQLEALIEKAVAAKMAAMPANPPVELSIEAQGPATPLDDPDAADPDTGRLPDHVIAALDAKREAGLKKKWAEA